MSDCCVKYQNKTFWIEHNRFSIKRIIYDYCPECGDRLHHGSKFKLSNLKIDEIIVTEAEAFACSKCGRDLRPLYCTNCGTKRPI